MEPVQQAMRLPVFSSLALLSLALASHAPALAPAAWLALLPALSSRLLPHRGWVAALRLAWLAGSVVIGGLSYGWLDGHTLRLALLLALALKWAEARTPGEFAFLAPVSLIAGAAGLLQWDEWLGLALIVLLLLCALAALEGATRARVQWPPAQHSQERMAWRHAISFFSGHLKRIALALPLAAALFVFFPRIPGPLLDIGLTLGLPLPVGIERSNQGLGVSTRLRPGQGQGMARRGAGENEPVLVAEFENWVPPAGQLYWRGPVYYDFDGYEWRLDAEYEKGQGRALMRRGWTKGAAFSATLARREREIAYTVRLTPHNRLWLYGLDLPTGLAAESFVSTDWQLLAHRPVTAETRYRLTSVLDWEAGGTLDEALRSRALALPETGNPRLRALGAELAAQPPDERAIAALTSLSKNGYKLRDSFEYQDGPDALDAFWFDLREGNADLYAGTFVFLMRAAGIPARLVAGYRGGKLIALTDYVIVKKNHAHAWVEVWSESKGWRRVDPADLVAPERFDAGQQARAVQPKPARARQAEPAKPALSQQDASPAPAAPTPAGTGPGILDKVGWNLPGLDDFLSRWVFQLDGKTQQALLAGLSGNTGKTDKTPGGKFAWAWLLAVAALASALVTALGAFIAWRRDIRRTPAPRRAWNRAVRLLGRRGLRPEAWECPASFARRAGAARPLWADALDALAAAYTDWRYAPGRTDAPKRVEAAARKLHNLILADTATPPRGAASGTAHPS